MVIDSNSGGGRQTEKPTCLPTASSDAKKLAEHLVTKIREGSVDEAEELYKNLCEIYEPAKDLLVFPVVIAIQRGHALDALRYLNGLPEERCPELKALCLNLLNDPIWHSYAESKADSADPFVRNAMRRLLGRDEGTESR
ncbi:hypothetical protein KAF44_24350 (plasmid) [Cupriavidus necator]|nr:hypothetical protein KAF44_24350 [Cupriavidus necator]